MAEYTRYHDTETFDHKAHPGCYLAVLQLGWGEICTLCYHHVLMYSVVTVRGHRKPLNLVVCAACGNALAACGHFTPETVCRLHEILMRRLQFDMEAARMRQEVEDYVPGEETVH